MKKIIILLCFIPFILQGQAFISLGGGGSSTFTRTGNDVDVDGTTINDFVFADQVEINSGDDVVTAPVIRVTVVALITTLDAGVDKQFKYVINQTASTTQLQGNGAETVDGGTFDLSPSEGVVLRYHAATTDWEVFSQTEAPSVAKTANEIVFGTGTDISTSPNFTYDGNNVEITGTTGGLIIQRMTTAQRTALANTEGLKVYDTDTKTFQYNDGTQWISLENDSTLLPTADYLTLGTEQRFKEVSDRTVTEVTAYTDITAVNFPHPTTGQLIKVADTGATYKFEDAAVTGYNGGAADGLAVIAVGAKFAILQSDDNSEYNIEWFDLVLDGVTDDYTKFSNAIDFACVVNGKTLELGTYTIGVGSSKLITTTLTKPFTLKGNKATIVDVGGVPLNYMFYLSAAGGQVINISGINFDGNNQFAQCVRIDASVNNSGEIYFNNCKFFDFKWTAGSQNYACGLLFIGGFEKCIVENSDFSNIGRAAGLNTVGSNGSLSLGFSASGSNYPKIAEVKNCTFDNVYTEDLAGSVNNSDCDHISYISVTTKTVNTKTYFDAGQLKIDNCVFTNAQGRSVKSQTQKVTVSNSKFIHNDGYVIENGLNDIALQVGGGHIFNCEMIIEPWDNGGTPTSPFQTGTTGSFINSAITTLVDYYPTTVIENISISNRVVDTDVGDHLRAVIATGHIANVNADLDIKGVNCEGITNALLFVSNVATVKSLISIENVSLDDIPNTNAGLISFNGSNSSTFVDIQKAYYKGANEPQLYNNYLGSSSFGGITTGSKNIGFAVTRRTDAVENPAANNIAAALGSVTNDKEAGFLLMDSRSLADNEIWDVSNFDQLFRNTGWMMITAENLSTDYNVILSLGFNAISALGAGANISTGTSNPAVPGNLNIWVSGGQLHMQNLTGATLRLNYAFLGNN